MRKLGISLVRTRQITLANQLLAQNAAITTNATWQQNEQAVNDLTILEVIQKNLTVSQLSQLDQIGMQCPWSGGDAVFRAQNLYNLFIPKEYDMYAGCTNLRDEKRANKSNLETLIYPNPTTGVVNLDKTTTSDCKITVFDVNGRVVFYGKAVENKIDLSDLFNGTYFINTTDSETGLVNHTKIVILK